MESVEVGNNEGYRLQVAPANLNGRASPRDLDNNSIIRNDVQCMKIHQILSSYDKTRPTSVKSI